MGSQAAGGPTACGFPAVLARDAQTLVCLWSATFIAVFYIDMLRVLVSFGARDLC
jgi:hypothetical protein